MQQENCHKITHTLQLAINGALNMITITDIITKAKLITKFFKKSLVAAKELTKIQLQLGLVKHKLIKCNNTW